MGDHGRLALPAELERFFIPTKTSKSYAWEATLTEYLQNLGEDCSPVAAELRQLDRVRETCRHSVPSQASIQMMTRYLKQLDSLSRRLPLAETPLKNPFVWTEAFDGDVYASQSSVAFEKANILFGLGGFYSNLQENGNEARNCQVGASIFRYIGDNFLHAPLVDISKHSLAFLSTLMLAQAQEYVVLKAEAGGKSRATVIRLASALAAYYSEAYSRILRDDLMLLRKTINDHDDSFVSLLAVKAETWSTVLTCMMAEQEYEGGHVGEAIAVLRAAAKQLKTALADCNRQLTKSAGYLVGLDGWITSTTQHWEKENGLIYTQSIPEAPTVAIPEGVSLVKFLPISECLSSLGGEADMFQMLIPRDLHAELSKYSEEKSKLLRYESLEVTKADTLLQSCLTALNFPSSLDKFLETNPSKERETKLSQLRHKVSKQSPDAHKSAIDGSIGKIAGVLIDGDELLDGEIKEYQQLKLKSVAGPMQSASHVGNASLYTRSQGLKRRLNGIKDLYLQVCGSIAFDDQEDVKMLLNDRLMGTIKDVPLDLQTKRENIASELRKTLDDLYELSKTRAKDLASLKEAILTENLPLNMDSFLKKEQHAFEKELAKFDDLCHGLEGNSKTQETMLQQIQTLWREAEGLKGADPQFEALLERVQRSVESYNNSAATLEYTWPLSVCNICLGRSLSRLQPSPRIQKAFMMTLRPLWPVVDRNEPESSVNQRPFWPSPIKSICWRSFGRWN